MSLDRSVEYKTFSKVSSSTIVCDAVRSPQSAGAISITKKHLGEQTRPTNIEKTVRVPAKATRHNNSKKSLIHQDTPGHTSDTSTFTLHNHECKENDMIGSHQLSCPRVLGAARPSGCAVSEWEFDGYKKGVMGG
jgi:hypothetical protein